MTPLEAALHRQYAEALRLKAVLDRMLEDMRQTLRQHCRTCVERHDREAARELLRSQVQPPLGFDDDDPIPF
jgi:hypothetical protein